MTTPLREKMVAQVNEMRLNLKCREPQEMAARCGIVLRDHVFHVAFYGVPHVIDALEFTVRVAATNKLCGLNRTALFLYYLQTADGAPFADKWIAFRDLPGGMFYHQAYQGYSGNRLAKAIGNTVRVFERAAANQGGTRLALGDAAFAFEALPRVRVAAVYHAGDEDFPATANVLFDASATHYLPTDALAGVGSALVDRLTGSESKDDQEQD